MRVVLAIDGSASSDAARKLVGSLEWPEGTCIRVVGVVEPITLAAAGLSPYPVRDIDESEISTALATTLAAAVTSLEADGRGVEARLLRGRPASLIVEQAAEFRAELIVVGNRGLGRLGSMLLGSVSAEVVDHAPCPVLVARSSQAGRILLAVDGSASSRRAVDHLGGTGYLAGHPVEVITVGPSLLARDSSIPTPAPVIAAELAGRLAEHDSAQARVVRERTEATAASAAEQLMRDGFEARWSISTGDPAHEIIEAAGSLGCDLIVLGSRGLTGLQRVLLGSVARNVLIHTHASVLIVREPVRVRLPVRGRVRAPKQALVTTGA
jgi:nucleotide-binding universal stress UspA family protein